MGALAQFAICATPAKPNLKINALWIRHYALKKPSPTKY